jgi:hypothetical protein
MVLSNSAVPVRIALARLLPLCMRTTGLFELGIIVLSTAFGTLDKHLTSSLRCALCTSWHGLGSLTLFPTSSLSVPGTAVDGLPPVVGRKVAFVFLALP